MDVGAEFSTPKGPKVWESKKRDIVQDNLNTAREIGRVRMNNARLNVFSAITEGEKVDNFKFFVDSVGGLKMADFKEGEARFQVLNKRGRVIADSDESTRLHYKKFQEMQSAEGAKWKPGEYFLRVTRTSSSTTEKIPYSVQLQMGTEVRNDYDTIEYEAPEAKPGADLAVVDPGPKVTGNAATQGGAMLAGMMTAGLDYMNNMLDSAVELLFGAGNR
jgi:hypothetical protein